MNPAGATTATPLPSWTYLSQHELAEQAMIELREAVTSHPNPYVALGLEFQCATLTANFCTSTQQVVVVNFR
jgi:hypothetical protein